MKGNRATLLRDIECALFMIGYDFPELKSKNEHEGQECEKPQKPKNSKVTAEETRTFALQLINQGLKNHFAFEFSSSDIRNELGGDLTTICSALRRKSFFTQSGVILEIIDGPKSGLGRVTYRAAKCP